MYKKHNSKQFLLLCLIIVILISASALVLRIDSFSPTANIIAQGGNISEFLINQSGPATMWSVVYGEFDEVSGISQIELQAAKTIRSNISTYGYDDSMVIISHTQGFNQSNISQVLPSRIDTYLGVGPNNGQSGTNTFKTVYNMTIGDQIVELYGTQTISGAGTYITAAFLSNGELGFVSTTENGTSFDGSPAFFQVMLPVNGIENYTFEVVSNITCSSSFFPLDGVLFSDNVSVVLNWSAHSDAIKYAMWYGDGLNASKYIEVYENTSVNTSLLTVMDTPTSTNRYYDVMTYLPAYRCSSTNTVGMIKYSLTPTANLISFPFEFVNDSVGNILAPIMPSFNSLNRYDNGVQSYDFYIQFMGSIFKNFDNISLGDGYWITINESVNLSVVGRVQENISLTLYNRSNLIGFPIIQGNNSVAYTLRSIDGNYSTVNVYDNVVKSYDFYIIFGGSVFSNFNTINPALGYWLLANESETIMLP